MTVKQPEALRLADDFDATKSYLGRKAAAELRRLHEINAELVYIFRRVIFEQGFSCECGIEDATWDLINTALEKINDSH